MGNGDAGGSGDGVTPWPFPGDCNIKVFGARGDGIQDDSLAINTAIDAMRKPLHQTFGTNTGQGEPVTFCSGQYRLTQPLDLTGNQTNLRGAGIDNTVLLAKTGGVALDMTQTTFSTVRDLLVVSGEGGEGPPSVLGILQARNSANDQASNNNIYDCWVKLETDATANNNLGTVALYNVGCENTTYFNVTLTADVGAYFSPVNEYDVRSPVLSKIGTDTSMTAVAFRGTSFIASLNGPAVRIGGGGQIDLGDTSLASQASQVGLPINQYAIDLTGQVTSLRYTGSVEVFPSLLRARFNATGLFLECYMAHSAKGHLIALGGPGGHLCGGKIDIVPTAGSSGGNLIQVEANYTTAIVEGMDITLYNQGIDLGGTGILRGCTIRSTRTLKDTLAGILATRFGNVITASDGVHIDPPPAQE
jgi:hypothetical protein